jgi:hypothetical protein
MLTLPGGRFGHVMLRYDGKLDRDQRDQHQRDRACYRGHMPRAMLTGRFQYGRDHGRKTIADRSVAAPGEPVNALRAPLAAPIPATKRAISGGAP